MSLATAHDLWHLLPEDSIAAELGVAEGRFSETLLAWPCIKRLYMVDRWKQMPREDNELVGDSYFPQSWHDANYARAFEVARTEPDRATILRGDTVAMAALVDAASLNFVYVDADHSTAGVRRDVEAWMPKLVPGGVMAFDDYDNRIDYGVAEVVESLGLIVNVTSSGRCAWVVA